MAVGQSSLSPGQPLPPVPYALERQVNLPSGQYLGSTSSEKLHPSTIELTFKDALERGIRFNLGLFLSRTNAEQSRAERWKAVSELLPHLEGSLRESAQRVNLRALGIPFANIPRTVDVGNSDARVGLTTFFLNLPALSQSGAAGASEAAARSDYQNSRDIVVVAISNSYLSLAASQALLDFAEADLTTAESLYQLAKDREAAGLSAEVDTLRAQVEWQSRQERVIEARNTLAKQKIALLRLLGFDIHQPIRLASDTGYEPVQAPTDETAYKQALEFRQDYRSEQEQLRSAQLAKRAAQFERTPKIGITADYGALGTAPGNAVATWNTGVTLRLPLFEGGRINADIAEADAVLRQKQAKLEDTRTRIAQQVEEAVLDLEAARQQVEVSHAALGYANRALTQSRDRFSAGVTNNIEVIQAQEALVSANEQWVNSLYIYNITKVLLGRAMGTAETSAKSFFTQSTGVETK